jgi:hypothetical protein
MGEQELLTWRLGGGSLCSNADYPEMPDQRAGGRYGGQTVNISCLGSGDDGLFRRQRA